MHLATFMRLAFRVLMERTSPKCKWIMALLAPAGAAPDSLAPALEAAFGRVEYRGEAIPFDTTGYYREEFGPELVRAIWCFRGVASPERLPDLKLEAARLEARWSQGGKRRYNLDIGYMDPDKVVLASCKPGPCKLYLRDGVFADLLLKYADGGFEPFPWAFPDFQDGRYRKSFRVIREKLKSDLRKDREGPPGSPT